MLRKLNTVYWLILPLIVVWLGPGLWPTLALMVFGLLWRWAAVVIGLRGRYRGPELQLESISASHFVEKVRWCLDRLGLDYEEKTRRRHPGRVVSWTDRAPSSISNGQGDLPDWQFIPYSSLFVGGPRP